MKKKPSETLFRVKFFRLLGVSKNVCSQEAFALQTLHHIKRLSSRVAVEVVRVYLPDGVVVAK